MKFKKQKISLVKDLVIIIFSLLIAWLLAKSGIIESFIGKHDTLIFLDSFLAGMFFVSIFTAAPAIVVLVEIIEKNSIWLVAGFGALGALTGDLLIFRFIKNSLVNDFAYLVKLTGLQRAAAIFRRKFFRWLTPLIGALIIASPLPDELGLAMMGLTKIKTPIFIILSWSLNFLGLLLIGFFAQTL